MPFMRSRRFFSFCSRSYWSSFTSACSCPPTYELITTSLVQTVVCRACSAGACVDMLVGVRVAICRAQTCGQVCRVGNAVASLQQGQLKEEGAGVG